MPQIGSLIALAGIALWCGAAAVAAADPLPLIKDLRGRGWDVGGGLSVHLDTVAAPANATIFDRHALRLDYNGLGVRFGIDSEDDAYKVGLYYGEGRGDRKKEISELIIPALLGYKTSALIVMALFGTAVFVVKALTVAKMAMVMAGALWAHKLLGGGGGGGGGQYSTPVEFEPHASELHPVYAEYPGDIAELGYAQTASGNYIAYAAPQQDTTGELGADAGGAAAATSQQYTFVEASSAAAAASNGTNGAQRRREPTLTRPPQSIHTFITVKRKSVSH